MRLISVPTNAPFADLLSNYQLPVLTIFAVDLRSLNLVICAGELIFICLQLVQ